MKTELKNLPDTPDELKIIIQKKQRRIDQLEEIIRLSLQRRFGRSSEKHPGQGELFDEAESLADTPEEDEAAAEDDTKPAKAPRKRPKKPCRKPLPAELPRVRIEHDLPEAEQRCACGCQRTLIGETTSEQLDIIPAKIQVLVHVRKKYACKHCEDGVKLASLPAQPIPKSMASPGLLSHIITSKYTDGMPLYRQQALFKRMGIDLGRNTMARWAIAGSRLLQALYNLIEEQLLSGTYLHADETPVQVLKEDGKTAQSRSYMWVRVGGPSDKKIILFDYAASRSGSVAEKLLAGFHGHLQTDAYAGYNGVCAQNGITQMGCWAHVRRKFIDAQKASATPKGKKTKTGKADRAVAMIGELYGIERSIKNKTAEQRHQIRQQNSVPVLKKLRKWLDKTRPGVLPKGLLGKALGYMDNHWDKLTVYTEHGELNIDNNPAENAIRPFVIGRKNWLFSDTPQGAKASAMLYSIIETAKANGLEPFAYLRRLFKELPAAQSPEDVEALLPWRVNKGTLSEPPGT